MVKNAIKLTGIISLALSLQSLALSTTVFAASPSTTHKAITVNNGILAQITAKAGKEKEVEAFLKSALTLANKEAGTTVWFAIKLSPSKFGIFDAFPDETSREAHLAGPIAAALMANAADLLVEAPQIEKVDVLAAKLVP